MTTTLQPEEAVTPESKLQIINIEAILPSPHQTRIFPKDWEEQQSTQEMVQSIREDGLFQPPLIRTAPDKSEKYYLIAGERRLRCCRLAGLKEIPVILKKVSEKEAAKITAAENYNREDLTIIEEAAAIRVLIEAYDGDIAEVAAYIDKSEAWVKSWAMIAELEECWKKLMLPDPEINDNLWRWKVGHWRQIARLDKTIQQDLYKEYVDSWNFFTGEMTINELKECLATTFCRMDKAIWPLDTFTGESGKTCSECYLRSDKQKGLFDEADDFGEKAEQGAKCLSKECYNKKWCEYQKEQYEEAKEKYGKGLRVGTSICNSKVAQDFQDGYEMTVLDCRYGYKKATKNDPKSIPIFILDGDSAGRVQWKKKDSYSSGSTSLKPETEEEKEELRLERLKKKRELLVVKFLVSRFTDINKAGKEYQFPKDTEYPEAGGELKIPALLKLSALVTIVGGESINENGSQFGYVSDDTKGMLIKKAYKFSIDPDSDTDPDLDLTLERLYTMCSHTISEALMSMIRNRYISQNYIKAICTFFELNHNALVKASEEAFPDRKGKK